jgi:hypothetical protein
MNIFKELKIDLIRWTKFCIRLLNKKGVDMFAFCVAVVTGLAYFYLWNSKALLAIFLFSIIIYLFKLCMFLKDCITKFVDGIKVKRKRKSSPYCLVISDKPFKQ